MKKILFNPKEDITVYELASIMAHCLGVYPIDGGPVPLPLIYTPILCDTKEWEKMGAIQRHWEVQE
jgi:hypothetical protein